jgi:F420-0:gamma-glutamyl ligase-like protein
MTRFANIAFAAAAALTLGALTAMPANAADVTVSLKGKSSEQIKADLMAAAKVVCKDTDMTHSLLGAFPTCVEIVYEDAVAQLPSVKTPGL